MKLQHDFQAWRADGSEAGYVRLDKTAAEQLDYGDTL